MPRGSIEFLATTTFSSRWPQVRPTVCKLLRGERVSKRDYTTLISTLNSVILWDEDGADQILSAICNDVTVHLEQIRDHILSNTKDVVLLKAYVKEWENLNKGYNYFLHSFSFIHIQNARNELHDHKLKSWHKIIFSSISPYLDSCAMEAIFAEGNEKESTEETIIALQEIHMELFEFLGHDPDSYNMHFEEKYFESTKAYFIMKAAEFLQKNGIPSYLQYANTKMKGEKLRVTKYLRKEVQSALGPCCVNIFLTPFKDTILAEWIPTMQSKDVNKLQLLYRLMKHIPTCAVMMQQDITDHIIKHGKANMIEASETHFRNPDQYIEKLLKLFHHFTVVMEQLIGNEPDGLICRDIAFKTVVNDTSVIQLELPVSMDKRYDSLPESRWPELLAHYCDKLLRNTLLRKKLTSEEIGHQLHDVAMLMKSVTNKDVFMRYYKVHLSRRLILQTSADNEMEENMIIWLRDASMPYDDVSNLQRMLQDIKISQDFNQNFKNKNLQSLHRHVTVSEDYNQNLDNTRANTNCNLLLLNNQVWDRIRGNVPVTLPTELEDYIPQVESHYVETHTGRKLQWHYSLATADINFANNHGTYELKVTMLQMIVLFLWNEQPNEKLHYESIRLASEIPDIELRRTLWSLVAAQRIKEQILMYSPQVKESAGFSDDTLFWINPEFSVCKAGKTQKRGKIDLIGKLKLSNEMSKQEDEEAIVQLRMFRVQEAIVRIMKMHKTITNAVLQTELVEMLKNMFLPCKRMIKE